MRQAWAIAACFIATPSAGQTVDPATHWPLPPPVLEERLAAEEFEIVGVEAPAGGVMGVKKLRIRMLADGHELAVKWKQAPPGRADGWNNPPRKEIAAYAIQKWFLDPGDYIVPTIVPRCMPPEHDARISLRELPAAPRPPHMAEAPEHTVAGSRCALGALVIWLDAVTVPRQLHDPERFDNDPLYARHLADFNTLTYLIDHEDGREGNFLVSAHDHHRRIFSIDNGVAFGSRVTNFLVPNWNEIRVGAIRSETVERLRKVSDDHYEALGVVAELRVDPNGVLRPVPSGANSDPKAGARVAPGWIQFGLNAQEIGAVRKRVDRLLGDVAAGKLDTF